MTSNLLKCQSFVPPLLELQISPPYRIVSDCLRYLQKWREYLCWCFCDPHYEDKSSIGMQRAIDELIKTILLLEIAKQYKECEIPSFSEIFADMCGASSYDISKAIRKSIPSIILQKIFEIDSVLPIINFSDNDHLMQLTDIPQSACSIYKGRIPITVLSDFHQMCLDIPVANPVKSKKCCHRKGKGIYYTPSSIVDYLTCRIMEQAFSKKDFTQILKVKILDPSCGCGAFLIASFRYLLEKLHKHFIGNSRVTFTERAVDLLRSTIYGMDIDPVAVNWTKKLLMFTAWQCSLAFEKKPSDQSDLFNLDLHNNIVCGDFLEPGQNMLDADSKSFDIIIGGPPFVRIQELYNQCPEKIEDYKREFKTATGQFDLYMLFMEKAIRIMSNDALLGMSVSNSFLRHLNGRCLRELIASTCSIDEIVEFEDNMVYPNASVRIALTILRKNNIKKDMRHIVVKGKGGLRRKLKAIEDKNDLVVSQKLSSRACSSDVWKFENTEKIKLLEDIQKAGPKISQLPIHIHFGVATGADKVFLLKNVISMTEKDVIVQSRLLNNAVILERNILKPILRGRHIHAYVKPEAHTFCICPYDKDGIILSESVMIKEYPNTYSYLKQCQNFLESRKTQHNLPWYGFSCNGISKHLRSPKILSSSINSGASFTLEKQNLLCSNSVVVINSQSETIDPYLLLAILNSSIFCKWASQKMPSLGNGWRSFRLRAMREFPIVLKNDKNETLMREIASRAYSLLTEYQGINEQKKGIIELDERICSLYGIPELITSS